MSALDWTTLALDGPALIEASAGTGKTHAITLLYLRLLLERGLSVRQILVCTFTEAATEELRARIRQRIEEAESLLAGNLVGATADATETNPLARWLARRAAADNDAGATLRTRLALARLELDQAAVFTLHGFCARALADFPFAGGALFARGELLDARALRDAVAQDLLRRALAVADPDLPDELRALDEAELAQAMDLALQHPDATIAEPDLAAIAAYRTRWHALRKAATARDVARVLAGEPADYHLNKPFRLALEQALTALRDGDWRRALPDALAPESGSAQNRNKLRGGETPRLDDLPALVELRALAALRPAMVRAWRARLLAAAMTAARSELPLRALALRGHTYADLIGGLAQALDGTRGRELAGMLHATWPVALVDEFQDTDGRQYAILQAIYAGRGTLLAIGDPKQAIYGFRGGDVYAYLRAARTPGLAHHALDTNWRSSTPLVAALNAFYAAAGPQALRVDGIVRAPVKAAGKADATPLRRAGQPLASALHLHAVTPTERNKEAALAACLDACAETVVALLNDRALTLGDAPLAPGALAVLVSRNQDVAALRRRLTARGVPCVGPGRASVMQGSCATEIETVLAAALDPGNAGRLRAALTTRLCGWSLDAVAALEADADVWRRETEAFAARQRDWIAHGVLTLLEPLIAAAAPRLLAASDGERTLTDLRHLAELLQAQQPRCHGPSALLAWLHAERIAADEDRGGDGNDERQLRIESDAARVQILTVHASKGLEFDIVLLPMLWHAPRRRGAHAPAVVLVHADDDGAVLDPGSAGFDSHLARWRTEQLGERLRQQYVALTRARHACHVFFAPALVDAASASGERDAFSDHLLQIRDRCGADDTLQALHALSRQYPAITLDAATTITRARHVAVVEPARVLAARADWPLPRPAWWLHSYSGLAHAAARASLLEPGPDDAGANEPGPATDNDTAPHAELLALAHLRGPRFGDAMHAVFEHAGPQPLWPQQRALVLQALRRQGLADAAGEDGARMLAALVERARQTDLGGGLRLGAVAAADRVAELEFLLPLHDVPVAAIEAAAQRHDYPPLLPAGGMRVLNGLLKGYMDLVLRHDGRYYVLDYKSNWLGERIADYAPARLAVAMREQRYLLQMLLYTVALHRHLRERLRGYAVARDLGGAIYLFARAAGLAPAAGVYRECPPPALIAELDALFAGAAERAA